MLCARVAWLQWIRPSCTFNVLISVQLQCLFIPLCVQASLKDSNIHSDVQFTFADILTPGVETLYMQFSICVAEQQLTFCVLTSMFQQAPLLLLHINNHHASPYCIGILMPPVNGSMWHKSSSLTASTWKHVDAWTSFHRAKLCLQNKREKSMTVYVNQGMFLYFLCPPLSPPPEPSYTSAWPVQQVGTLARASKPRLRF